MLNIVYYFGFRIHFSKVISSKIPLYKFQLNIFTNKITCHYLFHAFTMLFHAFASLKSLTCYTIFSLGRIDFVLIELAYLKNRLYVNRIGLPDAMGTQELPSIDLALEEG